MDPRKFVIWPACGASGTMDWLLTKPMFVDCPKYGVLNALNNSVRNCVFTRSVMEKFLKMEASRFRWPGEIKIFLPAFP